MTDTDPAPWILPSPKRLAMLADGMRASWPYEDTWQAVKACHDAGWTDTQIYRETFKLLLIKDSTPKDLLLLARQPGKRELRPGEGLPTREDAVAAVAEFRAKVAAKAAEPAHDDPEGGKVA
jgi:hypothetical protein